MESIKSTAHHHYMVRRATEKDVPSIAKMIKGLAEYLGGLDKQKIGEQELLRDGFGEKPLFYCLVAEEVLPKSDKFGVSVPEPEQPKRWETQILGVAIYFYTYSTWEGSMLYLEDLFVLPFARGQGIGTSIMKALAQVAKESNCSRIQWMSPHGRPSIKFYEKIGADCLEDWCVFRLGKQKLGDM